jgi:hypothetical protein
MLCRASFDDLRRRVGDDFDDGGREGNVPFFVETRLTAIAR